jgi:hypothetical protein
MQCSSSKAARESAGASGPEEKRPIARVVQITRPCVLSNCERDIALRECSSVVNPILDNKHLFLPHPLLDKTSRKTYSDIDSHLDLHHSNTLTLKKPNDINIFLSKYERQTK